MEFQHELVIPDEGLPFKFFLFEGSQGNYVREKHWHTSIEIFAVMEGSLTFYLNDEKHPLKAGELMIIIQFKTILHQIFGTSQDVLPQ